VGEKIHHPRRTRQDIGLESLDPETGCGRCHLFEERRPDASLPPRIGDFESELRARHAVRGGIEAMEPAEPYDLLVLRTLGRDERHIALEVMSLEAVCELARQTFPVFATGRADAKRFAVTEKDVGCEGQDRSQGRLRL
jgi:hypothetical protein